jgi:2-polyprenyl-3-methyl-5-hydroxy-6-metoxy-1,4-benzoquinol methylase
VNSQLPFDIVVGGVARFAAEAPWAWRLVRRYAGLLPAAVRREARDRRPTVGDAAGESPTVLVVADPEAYLVPRAARRLLAALSEDGVDVALPVSNEPWCEEGRRPPPFPYQTPSLLEEAAAAVADAGVSLRPARDPQSAVFATRRDVLDGLPRDLALDELPAEAARRGRRVAWVRDAYLHRYGEMDASARSDLAAKVPAGARAVLDVGCSRGATAARLRDRGVGTVVGIEPDAADAAEASRVCDRVLACSLEDVRDEFPEAFDAVLFGDVLEHLADPSVALARVAPWLAPGGVVVASVPNLGHWSIVSDLLAGRFDYVPYSLLSGTHLRFFTRATLEDLFEATGYAVAEIEGVRSVPSPEGAEVLAALARLPEASSDLDVVEFLVVARPEGRL